MVRWVESQAGRRRPRSWSLLRLAGSLDSEAFGRKSLAPIKIKSALPPPPPPPTQNTPPPLKRGILWTQVFLQNERVFPGVHKIGAAISVPRIADTNFTDTRIFLTLALDRATACLFCHFWRFLPSFIAKAGATKKLTLLQKESGKRSLAKKRDEKSDRSIRESDQKVTERAPKTKKKVIELLLPTSFCGTLKNVQELLAALWPHCSRVLNMSLCVGSFQISNSSPGHKRRVTSLRKSCGPPCRPAEPSKRPVQRPLTLRAPLRGKLPFFFRMVTLRDAFRVSGAQRFADYCHFMFLRPYCSLAFVAPYRAILRYYGCNTPYRATLVRGGCLQLPKMVRYPLGGT